MLNPITTAEQYYALASTFDKRQRDEAIANIPLRINRAGKLYQKLVKQICQKYPHIQ